MPKKVKQIAHHAIMMTKHAALSCRIIIVGKFDVVAKWTILGKLPFTSTHAGLTCPCATTGSQGGPIMDCLIVMNVGCIEILVGEPWVTEFVGGTFSILDGIQVPGPDQ